MKKLSAILPAVVLGMGLAMMAMSCEKGPAEKVGEKIDNAVQDTKDAAHDAAHDVKNDLKKKN